MINVPRGRGKPLHHGVCNKCHERVSGGDTLWWTTDGWLCDECEKWRAKAGRRDDAHRRRRSP